MITKGLATEHEINLILAELTQELEKGCSLVAPFKIKDLEAQLGRELDNLIISWYNTMNEAKEVVDRYWDETDGGESC